MCMSRIKTHTHTYSCICSICIEDMSARRMSSVESSGHSLRVGLFWGWGHDISKSSAVPVARPQIGSPQHIGIYLPGSLDSDYLPAIFLGFPP